MPPTHLFVCFFSFLNLFCVFYPIFLHLPPLSCSDGPGLLEGHRANRHGAYRAGGGPAVPLPAQHHHCGLHSLPGCHVLHHVSAHLLPTPLHPQLGRWRAPLQVRCHVLILCRKVDIPRSLYLPISLVFFFLVPAFLKKNRECLRQGGEPHSVAANKCSLKQAPEFIHLKGFSVRFLFSLFV